MSYAMDRGEGCAIRDLGMDNYGPYLPYVPLFSVSSPVLGMRAESVTCSLLNR
uniref:Uncharacterized protein n=1 Tax=Arundo donax TaxID=35708 RepID=A0A0A9B5P0_ARUDO